MNWISCDKEKPDLGEEVFLWLSWGDASIGCLVHDGQKERWSAEEGIYDLDDVSHWAKIIPPN